MFLSGNVQGSTLLVNHDFEDRLKAFDPFLSLHFCQIRKRWCVVEAARDGCGDAKLLIVAQNDVTKEAIPLGEWVFEALRAMNQNWQEAANVGAGIWYDRMVDSNQKAQEKLERQISDESCHRLMETRTLWRKAARELRNEPTSDVTAGYPRVTPRRSV